MRDPELPDPVLPDTGPTDAGVLSLEPDALDGHTVEELSDYLDSGRTPTDPAIESSPACLHALAALARLRELSEALFEQDVADAGEVGPGWVAAVLAGIDLDAHAGADFPIGEDLDEQLVMTEGALRGLVRAAGDAVEGVLLGRIRFRGRLDDRVAPLLVHADVVVVHGFLIPDVATALRARIRERVLQHTRFAEVVVDLDVRDVLVRAGERG